MHKGKNFIINILASKGREGRGTSGFMVGSDHHFPIQKINLITFLQIITGNSSC